MPELIPSSPERQPLPTVETIPSSPEKEKTSQAIEGAPQSPGAPANLGVEPRATPLVLTEPIVLQKKVEHVLEEGLEQLYRELNAQDQAKFRALGETTAQKLTVLLKQTKIKINEILVLVRQWLMSISGINRYFVEQEAKIKAEKLLKLRQEK